MATVNYGQCVYITTEGKTRNIRVNFAKGGLTQNVCQSAMTAIRNAGIFSIGDGKDPVANKAYRYYSVTTTPYDLS